jgi:L-ribulose-5-phosphate 4-epimerase
MLRRDDDKAAEVPGALVANHGPFTWGATARKSLEHAIICEAVAEMAIHTMALAPTGPPPRHLLDRHYTRKHGPDAYYGNPEMTSR